MTRWTKLQTIACSMIVLSCALVAYLMWDAYTEIMWSVTWPPGCRLIEPEQAEQSAVLSLREGRNRLLFDCQGQRREVWLEAYMYEPGGSEVYGASVDPMAEGKLIR
ncbi:MAG TPA: hypothetical protein VK934_06195 [Fimbriimonas sp.]|nr:hypothetical protein [Fimbriimonas sp.]